MIRHATDVLLAMSSAWLDNFQHPRMDTRGEDGRDMAESSVPRGGPYERLEMYLSSACWQRVVDAASLLRRISK